MERIIILAMLFASCNTYKCNINRNSNKYYGQINTEIMENDQEQGYYISNLDYIHETE
jgi:hypothetical protein